MKSKVSNIQNLTIEQFNSSYPVGTKVKYYPICDNESNYIETETSTEAYEICDEKMVGLAISHGGYSFSNIEVIGI